jgi:hypothetical protein
MEILFQNHLSNNFINPIYKIHSFNVLREYPVNLALFFFFTNAKRRCAGVFGILDISVQMKIVWIGLDCPDKYMLLSCIYSVIDVRECLS